ncbi:MAG: glycoside-pentoside-hexuronide (GPH):cation symporter [Clostridium sp.]|nr:glycoside-pentoside-hexuronide (GPH):cation symporter [Clostridium sp.]
MTTATKDHRLQLGEKVAYGLGDCAANVYVAMAGTFLTAFYTDTVGIAAAAVGTMMLLARVLDGVTDLVMGAIVDKTKSKYGKARPWVLWSAPFMCIGLILLFTVPSGFNAGGKLAYAYVSYIFMNCLVYTANNLPYNALLSRMTLNVQDRAGTASIRFVMTQITTLIINAITMPLVGAMGWAATAIVFGIAEMVMLLVCFLFCKEHIGEDASSGEVKLETVPLNVALPSVLKNRYFYLQALMFLFLYIFVVASGMSSAYFCNVVLGNPNYIGLCSSAQTIPAMIANFINPALVQKFGKRKLMMAGCVTMIVGCCVVGLAGTNMTLIIIGIAIRGFGMGPIMSGIFAMTADVVDYGEWKTGIRSEGLINSCTSFGMKVGIGLGSAVGTGILAIGGYLEGTAPELQPASAVSAIRFEFGYLGAIISAICLVLVILMNIDKYIKQIQADLEAKHAK